MTNQRNYYQLNENENIIGSSDNFSLVFDKGGFILTNQRVIKVDRSIFGGSSLVHTINLDKIDSVRNEVKKYIVLLALGCATIFIGLVQAIADNSKASIFTFIICGVFIISYFYTRKRVITISSGRTDMYLDVNLLSHEEIQKLVFLIESAQQEYLKKKSNITIETKVDKNIDDIENKLITLKDLFDKNIINENEYEFKKNDLLKRL
jgi:hypothetical protein